MGAVTAPIIMGAAIYLSHCHGGIPSVDGDAGGLPEFLGLNPRSDAGLSSGNEACPGSSFRWWDVRGTAGGEHPMGETTGDEGDEE